MKAKKMSVALWSLLGVSSLLMTTTYKASAQCIQSHTGIQLNTGKPAQQTNNVEQTGRGCSGVTQSSTSVQVNTRGRGGRQHQEVHQHVSGGGNRTGVNGPTVRNNVVVDVNVDTPEHFNRDK